MKDTIGAAIDPVIRMEGIGKNYGGVAALSGVDFALTAGRVHALVGENGAGKSTLTKILAGAVVPSEGEIRMDGAPLQLSSPLQALRHGIVMVYQETSLIPTLSVAQNIYLGEERAWNNLRQIEAEAGRHLQALHFAIHPGQAVAELSAAQRQLVKIARAVHRRARVIVFDEPTATLTPIERAHFFALVQRLKSEGVAIAFIAHALEEVLSLADDLTVLRDGRVALSGLASGQTRDSLIRHMVGRAVEDTMYGTAIRPARPGGDVAVEVENLSMGAMVRNSSFVVRQGQITGLFGLIGSGRTETAKIIAGHFRRDRRFSGTIRLDGRGVAFRSPRAAVQLGIAYITEDRKLEGMFDTLRVSRNIHCGDMARRTGSWPLVNRARLRAMAREFGARLNIRSVTPDPPVVALSGGNQQKVVIAKSLIQAPAVIIFDEPTRGVDVGAVAEIHAMINALADAGKAVIVISSYLPEAMGLADRLLVMRAGRVVAEFARGEADEAAIMHAAAL